MSKRHHYVWKDTGWDTVRKRATSGPAAVHAKAGVVGPEAEDIHTDSGLSVGEIAILQEFGSLDGHTPQRSFIRSAIVWNNRKELLNVLAQVSRDVMFRGVPRHVAMRKVGEWAVKKIVEQINSNVPPPNSPVTVANKGHGLTLRESYTLLEAIGYEVINGMQGEVGADDDVPE